MALSVHFLVGQLWCSNWIIYAEEQSELRIVKEALLSLFKLDVKGLTRMVLQVIHFVYIVWFYCFD